MAPKSSSPRKRRSECSISTPSRFLNQSTPVTAPLSTPEDTPEKPNHRHRRDPTGLRLFYDEMDEEDHRKRRRSRTECLLWILFVLGLFTISVVMVLNHNHLADLERNEQHHQLLLNSRLRHKVTQVSLNNLSSHQKQSKQQQMLQDSNSNDLQGYSSDTTTKQQGRDDYYVPEHKRRKKKRLEIPRQYFRETAGAFYRLQDIPRVMLPISHLSHSSEPVQPSLDNEDIAAEGNHRRVIYFGEPSTVTHRRLTVDPADYTDPTQLYSVLDSSDERIAHTMELRKPYVSGECVPMQEWQTTFHPSCNAMHELKLASLGDQSLEDDFSLFGMNGFWRNAWKLTSMSGHTSLRYRDTIVLKTLKINHRFEDAYYENHRIDAVVLERLTSSPHVINVFGFCGHTVMTEYADGKRLGELADKKKKYPLARLQIARDIANGLADVHGIDGDDNATFVHFDINPANVVSIGGTLKLNDFNIGVLRRWNTTSNTACGIPAQYPNPQWRSPEEARREVNLDEKVDVFSLGHIFFRLICGHEPWHKLEPGGMPSKERLTQNVKAGKLPIIPDFVQNSDDPEVVAIRSAMLSAYTYDPKLRPSARTIARALQDALDQLEAEQLSHSE